MRRYPSQAVILAAGNGVRLGPAGQNRPKGFLELAGLAIVERSVQQLQQHGIEEIVIVTGYAADYYAALARRYPAIHLIHNPEYAGSNSMYSLYCARSRVKADFLLLESDLVYEKRALEILLDFVQPNAILMSGFTQSDDEVFISTEGERVMKLSKQRAELTHITGELVGISKISAAMFEAMLAYATQFFQTSLRLDYESCINGVTATVPVFSCKVEDLIWAEIDTPEHLQRVKDKILPRLAAEWSV